MTFLLLDTGHDVLVDLCSPQGTAHVVSEDRLVGDSLQGDQLCCFDWSNDSFRLCINRVLCDAETADVEFDWLVNPNVAFVRDVA
jgi:hypothetical protein